MEDERGRVRVREGEEGWTVLSDLLYSRVLVNPEKTLNCLVVSCLLLTM